jgi:outer membrane protein assembly factor BamB
VSDGEHVYVYYGKTGALAFDLDGNQLWQQRVGTESGARGWGSASSPILYKNLLIVTASAESEALVGLEKSSGKEVWRQEARGLNSVWGTPILVQVDEQRTDLVIAVPGEIWGLNPTTGKLRWYCQARGGNSFCSSAVAEDGLVVAVESGPGGGGGVAVRAGGSGDVTESHVVWSGNQAGRIGSPILHDGRLVTVARGVVNCFDASNGEEIYQGRLQAAPRSDANRDDTPRGRGRGQDYASPVLADGKIYFTARSGETFVLEAGKAFKQLAANRVTSDHEDFSATPAICAGELFIRSSKALYCVAQLKEFTPPPVAQAPAKVDATPADAERGPGRGDRQGERGNRRGGEFDPIAIFQRSDANGDGKLSGDEISGRLRESVSRVDSDEDGEITREEFQRGLRAMFNAGGRTRSVGDSVADKSERPQRPTLED